MPILGSFAGISSKAYGLTSNLVGDYFFIAKAEATSGSVASLDFSSIPQQYTHLELRYIVNNTVGGTQTRMRFNSDSGATNYSFYIFHTDGSTQTTDSSVGTSSLQTGFNSNGSLGISNAIIQIQNYTNTNIYKTITLWSGRDTTFNTAQGGGLWKSGSAITNISLFPSANNFGQYSVAHLYGIK